MSPACKKLAVFCTASGTKTKQGRFYDKLTADYQMPAGCLAKF